MGTDWITEGAQVAEFHSGNPSTAQLVTVQRLTATQVVLDNGSRYNRETLRPVGDSQRSAWSGRRELMQANDPIVVNTVARQQLASVRRKVDEVCRGVGNDVENVLAALDDITHVVNSARVAIENMVSR